MTVKVGRSVETDRQTHKAQKAKGENLRGKKCIMLPWQQWRPGLRKKCAHLSHVVSELAFQFYFLMYFSTGVATCLPEAEYSVIVHSQILTSKSAYMVCS